METKTHAQKAWDFWKQFGEKPICLAPMAEVNDLAFRILCRNHGLKVCYTGMINAYQWNQGHRYQSRVFNTCEIDHPLIAQISGSNIDSIVTAAIDLSKYCDAIDINLGCTQHIAKRGGYGYFMVDTEEKRNNSLHLFTRLSSEVSVPITAKIRIFSTEDNQPDSNLTIQYAKQLQECGVSVIEIHGRFQQRDKKAEVLTNIIKDVVQSLDIPVIANGGICSLEDAEKMFSETGAAGVMVGQALLSDPTKFDPNGQKPLKEFSIEYLEIAKKYPEIGFFYLRKHFYNFFAEIIKKNPGIEKEIGEAETYEQLLNFANKYS
ncbi:tRNA-dihydrouridine(16/17) synthase [NAD(P)(+)]-like [Histomonas meleagridis]|uniref:tRNA-dihydrouridine(16/17) synthase [NAD(P)(+)]-like n=1 Tax=Histomonas meleagridis TaxID=135588 RepID=UPI00355A298B|nr:tRNA-dihydrouridine(16/17) synthase [NAD(P)(+)]-like [Histomonas meleagridis]KAH0796998.1 tRNA-dihydrouridine(16/17) synthase [NAD(P)(+)]-like [Histomonas meleagridis]